ncbi:hypothetical protein BUALT_Bualt08G0044900 [Buddleja alternifolia]|uniref:Uncharacterized protein n=1 Tax=Buddleja alternifolia TaxID=168488 RepID=A0AAV6XAU8_9LAMI|nr:hypothetical protein BUALT_Bualt08G0044900 [Buddleja alternifolia]
MRAARERDEKLNHRTKKGRKEKEILCNCRADLIGDVCSKTTNLPLCNQKLRTDPLNFSRGRSDLRGLMPCLSQLAPTVYRNHLPMAPLTKIRPKHVDYKDAYVYLNHCPFFLSLSTG